MVLMIMLLIVCSIILFTSYKYEVNSITLVLVFVTFVFFDSHIHVVMIDKLLHLVDVLFCGCLLHYGCDGCLHVCVYVPHHLIDHEG